MLENIPSHLHTDRDIYFISSIFSNLVDKIVDITIHLIDARNIALFIRSLDLDLEGYSVTFRKNFLEYVGILITFDSIIGSRRIKEMDESFRCTFRGFTLGFVDRYCTVVDSE